MAGMVVIYKQPADAKAFDKHYFETHIPLAKKIPGLRKYEVSRGPITVLAGPSDVYLIGTLHFDDLDSMQKGFASAEGKAAGADRRLYAPDESGVQMFIFDSREV
ncbi:EthD family reductase [Mesorhizobium hawassense]|uniref:EthD family reductase n=1 Tax=Mesorhizobium hawassense TaxID=1209954 RepID=A0A330HEA1_9HYPH|nr:EthD family reductase [Mesorhizobium hawassense]RAZ87016.1 EthD family reductase [Mesorhizobium hawassense]